jgi:hypothetical protein
LNFLAREGPQLIVDNGESLDDESASFSTDAGANQAEVIMWTCE